MKKLLLLFLLAPFFSVAETTVKPVVIKGTWNRSHTSVSLFRIISGRLEVLSTYHLQEDKTFGFAFTPSSEGYYVIGADRPIVPSNKYTFYFKPGDQLNLVVDDASYTLVGKNTPENIAMEAWHNYILPLEKPSYGMAGTYIEFFPLLEEKLAHPFKTPKTKNRAFNASFPRHQHYDFLSITTYFLLSPRTAHPPRGSHPDFYRNIDLKAITADASLLDHPLGERLMMQLLNIPLLIGATNERPNLEWILSSVVNDTLKGERVLSEASLLKSYPDYVDLMEKYGHYIITPDQKQRATQVVSNLSLKESGAGKMAINFTHEDVDGKPVSLTDFKGKVVVVDVWATWCGPCIQEIPALKKLEEEFKDQDVVFMSVSIDEQKDKEKWKAFLEKEQLHGVQLFGGNGWKSDIAQFYNINAIPRFMVFDKKGNIVSTEAPRPSSPHLKAMITRELQK